MKKNLKNFVLFGFCLLLGYAQIIHSWQLPIIPFCLVWTKDLIKSRTLVQSGINELVKLRLSEDKVYALTAISLGVIASQNVYLQRKNIRSAYRSLKRVFKRKTVKQKAEQEKNKKEVVQ